VVLIQDTCRSYHFALPNKLFEYIQAGIPVVGSDLPEIAHIIRDNQIGEFVDPNNPDSIANAIQHLLNDPEYYTRSKLNTRRAAKIFNWERESSKLLDLYANLEQYTIHSKKPA
jgi:glycosyltransferase involved in cell wall biosynthesis